MSTGDVMGKARKVLRSVKSVGRLVPTGTSLIFVLSPGVVAIIPQSTLGTPDNNVKARFGDWTSTQRDCSQERPHKALDSIDERGKAESDLSRSAWYSQHE